MRGVSRRGQWGELSPPVGDTSRPSPARLTARARPSPAQSPRDACRPAGRELPRGAAAAAHARDRRRAEQRAWRAGSRCGSPAPRPGRQRPLPASRRPFSGRSSALLPTTSRRLAARARRRRLAPAYRSSTALEEAPAFRAAPRLPAGMPTSAAATSWRRGSPTCSTSTWSTGPDWIARWDAGDDDGWQAALWRRLAARTAEPHRARVQAAAHACAREPSDAGGPLPRRRRGLRHSDPAAGVPATPSAGSPSTSTSTSSVLDPCSEYWADLIAERICRARARRADARALHLEPGPPLLAVARQAGARLPRPGAGERARIVTRRHSPSPVTTACCTPSRPTC